MVGANFIRAAFERETIAASRRADFRDRDPGRAQHREEAESLAQALRLATSRSRVASEPAACPPAPVVSRMTESPRSRAAADRLARRLLAVAARDAYCARPSTAFPPPSRASSRWGVEPNGRHVAHPRSPWLDDASPVVAAVADAWAEAVRGAVRYPPEAWTEAVKTAAHVALRAAVTPPPTASPRWRSTTTPRPPRPPPRSSRASAPRRPTLPPTWRRATRSARSSTAVPRRARAPARAHRAADEATRSRRPTGSRWPSRCWTPSGPAATRRGPSRGASSALSRGARPRGPRRPACPTSVLARPRCCLPRRAGTR